MGDQKVSRKRLSEATAISRPSLANKLDGKVEFTYAELLSVIEVLGIAWEELLDASPLSDPRRVRLGDMSPLPEQPPL
jgi:Cro/C1-type HTH DNA-binding domain